MRLKNKIAIITGAAGGMGEAAALLFAREGAKVAVVDVKQGGAEATVARIRAAGGEAIAITADITKSADVIRIGQRTVAELGLPNILFNNAGIDAENKKWMLEVTEEEFDLTVMVNLKGPWLMMKHLVPLMIEAGGGSIINTASIGAFVNAGTAAYCASKAGVVALTRVAAVELGTKNIRVNALCPGATETPMAKEQRAEMEKRGVDTKALIGRMSVLGRLALPEEMAQMALFLASDESSYATGAAFNNDGGWTANGGIRSGM